MATFNTAHHESGGVVLFSGELILLFCDNVHLTLPQTSQDETGRLYLTTHRLVFTSKSMRGSLKSFSAPFYSMHDLSLEQPIFGANYIKGKVNDAQTSNSVTFKLKFNSGGAIEYGQALQSAARLTRSRAGQNAFQAPPPYTASASQYYQAPPTVYQPAYNCGFVLPTDIFNQAPPAGFIYTSEAPPPYPGLGPQQQTNPYPAPGAPAPGYAPTAASGYPPAGGPPPGYAPPPTAGTAPFPPAPGAAPYPPALGGAGYPPATGYPGAQPTQIGFVTDGAYPPAQPGGPFPPAPGYYPSTQPAGYPPTSQPGYPPTGQPGYAPTGQPGYPPTGQPGYPPTSQPGYPPAAGQPSYPSNGAPGYPPLHSDFAQASAPPEKKPW